MSVHNSSLNCLFPGRLILAAALLTTITLLIVLAVFYGSYRDATSIQARNEKLQTLSSQIMLYDEQLTSSAMLAAHSGDSSWIDRYQAIEPKLIDAINEALTLAESQAVLDAATLTEQANVALVEMEMRAFDQIRDGRTSSAVELLSGERYQLQKARYSDGMRRMISTIDQHRLQFIEQQRSWFNLLLWIVPLCLAIASTLWMVVFQVLRNWSRRFEQEEKLRSEAELKVHELNTQLERRIEKRTAELQHSKDLLSHQANHDDLTGLPNRRCALDRLRMLLRERTADQQSLVAMVDLDHFKRINDTLGHAVGDAILVEAANRLQNNVGQPGVVARLGGDEFLILSSVEPGDKKSALFDNILQDFRRPFVHDDKEYQLPISPSIGIAISPDNGDDPDTLIRHADTAMYTAKESGRNRVCYFVSEMNDRLNNRIDLETKLRAAVDSGNQFHMHYQPQIDLTTNEVIGVEALLRWTQPEDGTIPPDQFIPIAEDSGIILDIGRWVLFEAARQYREWRDNHGIELNVSINVATQQLQQPGFFEDVARALHIHNTAADAFGIEITESSLIGNDDTTRNTIDSLHRMGLKISMDDFGTGYSALSHLQQYPFEYLKIDRAFIQSILDKPTHGALVKGIIKMSRNLNMKAVAEGTETADQCELLRTFGCDVAQGFFYSKPLSPADLVHYIRSHNARQEAPWKLAS
jgi:diguanylate cyclase (GGDEF)-like protein